MKNLANCKPSEFLKQTNLIKKSVEKWITVTDIKNIRARMPEKKEEAYTEEELEEQGLKNLSAVLDAMLDIHAEETLEVLALCCFVEPEKVDDYTMSEYLEAIHLVAQVLQIAEENIEGDGRTGVAQMRIAVDGGAADIHAHVRGVQRLEAFFLSCQCIVDDKS